MPQVELLVRLVGMLLLLAGNAFFVAIEFALTRLRQHDESEIPEEGGLRRAWEMTDELEYYLTGCQLGITIMSVSLGVVAEPALSAVMKGLGGGWLSHGVSILLALALLNLAHLIFAEQAPTYLGVERALFVARYLGPIHAWWTYVMWPAIWLADKATKGLLGLFGVSMTRSWAEEESEAGQQEEGKGRERGTSNMEDLRHQLASLLTKQGVPQERRKEILASVDIGEQSVGAIMIPRADICVLGTHRSFSDNLHTMKEAKHARYPLMNERDEPVGVVYATQVIADLDELSSGALALQDIASGPVFLNAASSVAAAIDTLQEAGEELALIGAADDVKGIITVTDALEEIVGELTDPTDVG